MVQSNYYSIYPCINIYERPSTNSKISSQIIYGEKFKVLRKIKSFLKIRTSYDRYTGYIKNKNFIKKFKPTHKVKTLRSRIYKSSNFLPVPTPLPGRSWKLIAGRPKPGGKIFIFDSLNKYYYNLHIIAENFRNKESDLLYKNVYSLQFIEKFFYKNKKK